MKGSAVVAKWAWVVALLAALLGGALNRTFRVVEDAPLVGIDPPPRFPIPTPRDVYEEAFQRHLTDWYDQTWGLRGYAIRTDNTANAALFAETRAGSYVVKGDHDVLFSVDDLDFFNRTEGRQKAIRLALRFVHAQQILQRHDKLLLPVVIPSKTTFLHDEIPSRWKRQGAAGASDANLYGAFVQTLEANGARFVDARALLLAENRDPLNVFPREGRHWHPAPACRTLQAVIDAARPSFPAFGEYQIECGHPAENERNLTALMNAWPIPNFEPAVWPRTEKAPDGLHVPTLYVGSSFLFSIFRAARAPGVLTPSLYYFYDEKRIDTTTEAQLGKVEPGVGAWREDTLSKSLYIVDVLETRLPDMPVDFLDEMERALEGEAAARR